MKSHRKTNEMLVEEMSALLTHDFELTNCDQEKGLKISKDWRNKAWHLLKEIDKRLNPCKYINSTNKGK